MIKVVSQIVFFQNLTMINNFGYNFFFLILYFLYEKGENYFSQHFFSDSN